jgi:hypothetical protein
MRQGGTGTVIGVFARTWWPLAAVAALLALASVAAAHSSLQINRTEAPVERAPLPEYEAPTAPPTFPATTPQELVPAEPSEIPGWLTTAALGICLLITLVVIAVPLWQLLRGLVRRRAGRTPMPQVPSSEETAQEVVAALDAGLVDLSDSDADPRRAVIACWVRLEQAAAAAGLPRQVGDTPTDLVGRLLGARAEVSADVLAAFAHVYREARYATHTVDESMRGQARAALQRLRGELTAGGPTPLAGSGG